MINLLEKFKEDLEESMRLGLGMLTFDNLVSRVNSENLFVLGNEDAVIVFEKRVFGGLKIVNTVVCGGKLNAVAELQKQLESDAKEMGANGVMIIGRSGWGKVFDGYKNAATVFFKEFTK